MIRRIAGTFRTINKRVNLRDNLMADTAVANQAQYTKGSTQLDTLAPLFPPSAEDCEAITFSVSARVCLEIDGSIVINNSPLFGRLGKIVTGLTMTGNATGTPLNPGSIDGVRQLPNDLSLVGDLWNPANDPLPPSYERGQGGQAPDNTVGGFVPPGLQIGLTQTLPERVPMFQGSNALMGIWLLPSLIVAAPTAPPQPPGANLVVLDATYSVTYDDGT